MQYVVLATDYDGTIAHDGVVDAPTLAALEHLRPSGRKLILVTGRELDCRSRKRGGGAGRPSTGSIRCPPRILPVQAETPGRQ